MPSKEYVKNEEQATAQPANQATTTTVQLPDIQKLLTTLDAVLATSRGQSSVEAPPVFSDNAKRAVSAFGRIVADLTFTPPTKAIELRARVLSLSDIELTWTDDTKNAAGYLLKRCQGQDCQKLVEIRRHTSAERRSVDSKLESYTTYRYQVVAFGAQGETTSNTVTVTTTNRAT